MQSNSLDRRSFFSFVVTLAIASLAGVAGVPKANGRIRPKGLTSPWQHKTRTYVYDNTGQLQKSYPVKLRESDDEVTYPIPW
jgi:hypothetical protein